MILKANKITIGELTTTITLTASITSSDVNGLDGIGFGSTST
jgi:hypothetical protein